MRFARLDHIVLQVPEIASAHARLLSLGFEEAWPIGRNWPHGPTSGIALGGINLELLQPDEEAPEGPRLAEIVFQPMEGIPLESYGRVVEKIETDPEKLAARGFPPAARQGPQRICTNAFPGSDSPWPHFVCDYAGLLRDRLAPERFGFPFGRVARVEIGLLRVRPRFVEEQTELDLPRFLTETVLDIGPVLAHGPDAVVFDTGARLDLARLTIEA